MLTTRDFGDISEIRDQRVHTREEQDAQRGGEGASRAVLPRLARCPTQTASGDGLLPADVDGKTKPKEACAAPIVGTQDDGGGYGATFDAVNIWELDVQWNAKRGQRR